MIFWVRNHPANILKNRWTTFYSRNSYLKNITVGKVRPKVTKMEFIEFEIFNGSAWVFLYLHSLKARYRAPNVNQRGLEVLSHFIETINCQQHKYLLERLPSPFVAIPTFYKMAPQVVNIELLLSSTEISQNLFSTMNVMDGRPKDPIQHHPEFDKINDEFALMKRKSSRRQKRKYSATSVIPSQNPLHIIKNLLFPGGQSMAYCNEETLSSSFLILDGFMTISLWDVRNGSSGVSAKNATERWGNRLETNICVGKVSYEYRLSDEVEKSMGHSSEEGDEDSNRASILSQNLKKIPLVLDQEPADSGAMLDPDRYLPPSHKMVADALKVSFT